MKKIILILTACGVAAAATPALSQAASWMAKMKEEREMLKRTLPAPAPRLVSAYNRVYEMSLNQEDHFARMDFDKANRAPCASCAGGFAYDIATAEEVASKKRMDLPQKVGATPKGQSVVFTGKATGATITITVVNETPIGKWKCKQAVLTSSKKSAVNKINTLYCYEPVEPNPGWYEVA